jgi:apolipoprotein N-acyltransferase
LTPLSPRGRLALAAFSGLLLALSFPKFGHPALAFVALAPLLIALPDAPRPFLLGWLCGFVAAVGLLYWTALVVIQFGGVPVPVAGAVMLLLCAAVALFCGAFGWVMGGLLRWLGPTALLLAPLVWAATELLRAHTLFDFAWCLLGYSQQENLAQIQIARLTGVYGVSASVALCSAALAHARVAPRPSTRRAGLLLALGCEVAVLADGFAQLRRPVAETGRLVVGLVQARILQDEKWDADLAWRNVQAHEELTRQAAAAGARLVIWPESAVPFYYDLAPELREELGRLTQETGTYLLFGNDDRDDRVSPPRIQVGAKLLDPQGVLVARYHKMRLVPFGEYVPLQPLLTLGGRFTARLVQQVGDFQPGTEASLAAVDGHQLGTFICYEAIFPDHVRLFADGGAELLVNITNDAWYGFTSAPYQHFAMAAMRAVENGRYLVRAANTGFSGVVDPRGRVLRRSALFEKTAVVAEVPLVGEPTFYGRHGDVFAWSCLALVAGLLGASRLRRP